MAWNMCLLVLMSLAVLASAENEGTWLFSSLNKVPASPPAPTDPSSVIVYNMMDCMDFLTLNQPNDNKPSSPCCTGFESVLAALCGATTFDTNLCEANATPPQGSSTNPPPPAPGKKAPAAKAPAAATAARTVSQGLIL